MLYLKYDIESTWLLYEMGCMIRPILEMRIMKLKEVNLPFSIKVISNRARLVSRISVRIFGL